ncbi:MAG TPA: hypothetical protein PKA00_06335 [Saprospiraceae bacterium]|nr:hypothetical protein [Saprospiraceae bacterium]HMQ82503.1 hypothetical protein [Saprospiraceae bacterium]
MKIENNNRQIWQDLFQAAIAFRDLKPWEWMYDTDLFGVQDPVSGEIGWCCIMGNAEEVYALCVYLGDEGFASYDRILSSYGGEMLEMQDQIAVGLEQKMLKVEFVGREEITTVDRAAYKSLGLKFRGENQWIQIREVLPSYYPWYISDEQAVFLTHCLRQAAEVAKRYQADPKMLQTAEDMLLVVVPATSGKGVVWKDSQVPKPTTEDTAARTIDPFLVNRAKKELEKEAVALCFSLSYIPGAMEDKKGERPFFTRFAVWIAYGSGMITGFKILSPEEMDNEFDAIFLEQLHLLEMIPQQLVVDSKQAFDLVEPIAEALEIELIHDSEIEEFAEMKNSLGIFLGGEYGF